MKRPTVTAIIVLVALSLALLTWGRLVWVIGHNPPPARFADFHDDLGPIEPPSWPLCHAPHIADGDRVWSWCYDTGDDVAWRRGFCRFDLAANRADLLWPFPESEQEGVMSAWLPMPDGGAVVALAHPARLFRLGAEGGHTPLPELPGRPRQAVALALDRQTLEVVTGGRLGEPALWRTADARGWSELPIASPDCLPDMLCYLGAARHSEGSWTLSWVRHARRPPPDAPLVVEILEGSPSEPPTMVDRLTLPPLVPHSGQNPELALPVSVQLEPGEGHGLLPTLDMTEFHLLERRDSHWQPLALPPTPPSARFRRLHSDYVVERNRLAWIPRPWDDAGIARVGDRWLGLSYADGVVSLAPIDGPVGRPLATDRWLHPNSPILPAPAGGYRILGAFGTHLAVGPDFARSDTPGVLDRLGLLYGKFRHLAWYNDFWLTDSALKKAVLPVCLLLIPLALTITALARGRRWLVHVAIAAMVVVLPLMFWFWRLTAAL